MATLDKSRAKISQNKKQGRKKGLPYLSLQGWGIGVSFQHYTFKKGLSESNPLTCGILRPSILLPCDCHDANGKNTFQTYSPLKQWWKKWWFIPWGSFIRNKKNSTKLTNPRLQGGVWRDSTIIPWLARRGFHNPGDHFRHPQESGCGNPLHMAYYR